MKSTLGQFFEKIIEPCSFYLDRTVSIATSSEDLMCFFAYVECRLTKYLFEQKMFLNENCREHETYFMFSTLFLAVLQFSC
jgi:hypothetical protein